MFAVDQVSGRLLQRSFQDGWRGWVDRGLGLAGSVPIPVSEQARAAD